MTMLPDDERRRLLEWGEGRRVAQPPTLPEQVRRVCDKQAERIAVEGGLELSYGDLWERSGAVACALKHRGAHAGDVVGVYFGRSADVVVALLGVWRAGCAYLPLDPDFPDERLAFMVEDSGASLVITDGRPGPSDQGASTVTLSSLEAVEYGDADEVADGGAADDLAYILYTSGSTGRPKGVEVTHANLANFIGSMVDEPGLTADDTVLAVTTLSFDISALELWGPLVVGGRVVLADEFEVHDGELLMERLDSSGATVMQATPATWRMLLQAGWEGPLRQVLCGGEAFPAELVSPLRARAGEVWNMYGPTETTVWSTIWRIEEVAGPIPIGRPIDNTRVYVVDDSGALAPEGGIGELWIGGAGVAAGYRGRPQLTSQRFASDPFSAGGRVYRTGDRARWRSDGVLEHFGRTDDQVQVQGHRIELGEIEACLAAHDEVRQAVAAVIGAGLDARLVAFVQRSEGAAITGSELRRFMRASLPDYMIPGLITEVGTIPLTPNGKVDRRALVGEVAPTNVRTHVEPETEDEVRLAGIWMSLLGTDAISVHDNFFELGGHSLLAARAVARFAEETGRRLDPRIFFFSSLRQILAAEAESSS